MRKILTFLSKMFSQVARFGWLIVLIAIILVYLDLNAKIKSIKSDVSEIDSNTSRQLTNIIYRLTIIESDIIDIDESDVSNILWEIE